jgi:hypothetical protein
MYKNNISMTKNFLDKGPDVKISLCRSAEYYCRLLETLPPGPDVPIVKGPKPSPKPAWTNFVIH